MKILPLTVTLTLAATALSCASHLHADDTDQIAVDSRIPIGMERPWQTNDGLIHHQGQIHKSWSAYFESERSSGILDHRCGTQSVTPDDENIDGSLASLPPSDCSCSNNNPAAEYDPAVGVLRIPCVVHVIRNSSGTLGDIPIDRVISGIRILNEDFQALSGTNGSNGNDAQIEFYLATVDPDGNSTTGMTFSNNDTWYNDGGSYWNSLNWDPSRYMNIYTTTAGGNLGYVPFLPACGDPGASSDRVVVLWESYGENAPIGNPYNLGRTLTHEVGHYLGLNHTFNSGCESGNCSTGGDLICDTNPQNSATFGCNGSSCSGVAPDDNYMDYSDDQCMEQFSPEQNKRMRCSLEYYRPELTDEIVQLIQLSQVGTNPELISPSSQTFQVRITEVENGGYLDGSGSLLYSTGGSYQQAPLNAQGGGIYSATLTDNPCGNQLSWYFTARDSSGTTRSFPTSGAFAAPIAEGVEVLAAVDFDTDAGWSAQTTATAGGWERAIPSTDSISVDDCSAPGTDADGSGYCWVTGNGNSTFGCEFDIDGGSTVLTSTTYAVTDPNTEASFAWWYDNTSSNNTEFDDQFIVEASGNSGSTWSTVLTISNGDSKSSGWSVASFRIGDFVTLSSGFQVRITASDADPGSVVEAGIDAFRLSALDCGEPPTKCVADVNGDNVVGGSDLASVLAYWDQVGSGIVGDINNDLVVDGRDLATILASWGPCPE
jgi:hypothetical protein